jgi:hypothetical protein
MPTVPQYDRPRVETRVPTAVQASANTPSGAFQNPLVQGGIALGQGIAQNQQRIATTASEEALVNFEREKNDLFFNPESGYFNTQGRNAFDQAKSTNEALSQLRSKYSDTLESPTAKQMFGRAADAVITRSNVDIMRHSAKGLQAWEVATLESQVENSVENASLYWNDPDRMKVQGILGRQAVIDAAEMQGITGEALNERLQNFESTFSRSAIEAATSSSSEEGQAVFDQLGSRLEGPDRAKVEKQIQAKANTEKVQQDGRSAVLIATNLVDTYDTRSDIISEVNKIDDPDLRKKTMSQSMHQFNLRKQAESEERGAAFEDAETHLFNGGSAESYQASNPEEWEKLSPKQKKVIESGKAISTDWALFSDLVTLPNEMLAKVNPVDYFDQLNPAQRNQLISAVKSARGKATSSERVDSQNGRSRTAQTSSAVQQIFGKKNEWKQTDLERVNLFYQTLDDEVTRREELKGTQLTSEEYTNVLSGFTREYVEEGIIFDSTFTFEDIPPEDVTDITTFLRERGLPVTTENMVKVFRQVND